MMYATCETEGCSNSYIPIEVPSDMFVICGVCSEPISNISDIEQGEGKELPPWISEMLKQQNSDD